MRPAKVNLRAAPHRGGSSTSLYRTATKLVPPMTATPISAVTTSLSGLDGTFCPPSYSVLIHLGVFWSPWLAQADPDEETIFLRMSRPLVPRGATALNPSLLNMPGVPNHRHSGTAAIFLETTGYASTVPPPFSP